MNDLASKHCVPCEGNVPPLSRAAAESLQKQLRGEWKLAADGKSIEATFPFKDYYRTTAFVTAAAYVAHREDHHPDIAFGYNKCTVKYWTHAVDGLTENDFICAAKVDQLLG